jgi:hypothetical protein
VGSISLADDPEDYQITEAGKADWAAAIAPVIGISNAAARQAADSDNWIGYEMICD